MESLSLNIQKVKTFLQTYSELMNKEMSFELAYRLNEIAIIAQEHMISYNKDYEIFLQNYAERDESGKRYKQDERGNYFLKEPITDEAKEWYESLQQRKYDFCVEKIPLELFKDLKMSPALVNGLRPFIAK